MLSLLAVTLAAAPDAALLERLAARAVELEAFTNAATVTFDVQGEELDGDGRVTKTKHTRLEVTRDGQQVTRRLLLHEEDGADLTESKRAQLEAPPKSERAVQSPFHPDRRAAYRFDLLPPSPEGQVRIAFQPAGEKTPELFIGDATVDAATGELLALSVRLSKNPAMVDALSMDARFDAPTPAGRAMSQLTMRGVAGFLFFKKRFRVVTTLSDYRPRR